MTYAKTAFASVASAAALLLASSSAHAAVVINEVLRNTSGAAGEYVELFNNGAAADEPIDIGGWKVKAGTSSLTVRATVPAGTTLAPGAYWLVMKGEVDGGAPADAGATGQSNLTGNLPGATGNNLDCVQLTKADDSAVDTIVFGKADAMNTDGFLDDTGVAATTWAPVPAAGRSLYRKENGVDTNASNVDFVLAASPAQNTPGAANYTAPPIPDAGPTSSSSSGSQGGSSGRPSSSSGGTGGSSSSGSSGSRSDGGRSSGGINPEGDDDEGDNSNLAADEGGCSTTAATPGTFLIGLAALFVMRRRRRA